MIDEGRLRHRVKVQQKSQSQDGSGGLTSTWADLREVWAEIKPLSSQERLMAAQADSQTRYRIIMRHRGDVTGSMRVIGVSQPYKDKVFNIGDPMPMDADYHFMMFDAVEGAAPDGAQ